MKTLVNKRDVENDNKIMIITIKHVFKLKRSIAFNACHKKCGEKK